MIHHAEDNAIRKLKLKPHQKCDMLVIRISYNKDGSFCIKNSKPCYHCVQKIRNAKNINRIYYSTSDGNIEMINKVNLVNNYVTTGNRIK